jgi:S-adenosylmethionine:tRNA ribosyltransferase-isomerase
LHFRGALHGKVMRISDLSERLIEVEFKPSGPDFFRTLYELGHPVQYSYLKDELSLYHVQSAFGSRPWAMEMPSAGASLPLGLLWTRSRGSSRFSHPRLRSFLEWRGGARCLMALRGAL